CQQQRAYFETRIKQLEASKAAAARALKEAENATDEQRRERIANFTKQIETLNKEIKAIRKEGEDVARKPVPFETAYAVAEARPSGKKKVGNACIQIKGDPERLGREVPRHFPAVLGGQVLSPDVQGSGRLELARWITDPANPLTARVLVN